MASSVCSRIRSLALVVCVASALVVDGKRTVIQHDEVKAES